MRFKSGRPARKKYMNPVAFMIGWQALDNELFKNGADDGTRTHDLLITNQLLYQLSYIGFF